MAIFQGLNAGRLCGGAFSLTRARIPNSHPSPYTINTYRYISSLLPASVVDNADASPPPVPSNPSDQAVPDPASSHRRAVARRFHLRRPRILFHPNTTEIAQTISNTTEAEHAATLLRSRQQKSAALLGGVTRRNMWRAATAVLATGAVAGAGIQRRHEGRYNSAAFAPSKTKLAPVNLTQVAHETRINVTMECTTSCVTLDPVTFQKKQTVRLPDWVPDVFVPPPKVIKDIPNYELLLASIVAGSAVEMGRTTLLYPLTTLKTRIQADINTRQRNRLSASLNDPRRRIKIALVNLRRHFAEGNLFAGIVPSVLVAVPATGVYYGIRDVVKRGLAASHLAWTDESLFVVVMAAFVADVASTTIQTPADTLALRLQAATGKESRVVETEQEAQEHVDEQVGSWFRESIERLPAAILTDLPYLLSRIALYELLISSEGTSFGYYEATTITVASLCAFMTTPFDVVRTRILVDSDDDPPSGIDGGSGEGLIKTFKTIYNEGGGGMQNLFAGWLERTAYFGIGRAWIEPLMLIGFIGMRDAILLQWFD